MCISSFTHAVKTGMHTIILIYTFVKHTQCICYNLDLHFHRVCKTYIFNFIYLFHFPQMFTKWEDVLILQLMLHIAILETFLACFKFFFLASGWWLHFQKGYSYIWIHVPFHTQPSLRFSVELTGHLQMKIVRLASQWCCINPPQRHAYIYMPYMAVFCFIPLQSEHRILQTTYNVVHLLML